LDYVKGERGATLQTAAAKGVKEENKIVFLDSRAAVLFANSKGGEENRLMVFREAVTVGNGGEKAGGGKRRSRTKAMLTRRSLQRPEFFRRKSEKPREDEGDSGTTSDCRKPKEEMGEGGNTMLRGIDNEYR